ncbi:MULTISPECIES: hypothetical protein [unclassified Nocardioides]|nr:MULTISPECIES: hypothetical protein [unclassified Nocardioides]
MTWHTVTVAEDGLEELLLSIRRAGGSITHSFPGSAGYTVIYATVEN